MERKTRRKATSFPKIRWPWSPILSKKNTLASEGSGTPVVANAYALAARNVWGRRRTLTA